MTRAARELVLRRLTRPLTRFLRLRVGDRLAEPVEGRVSPLRLLLTNQLVQPPSLELLDAVDAPSALA